MRYCCLVTNVLTRLLRRGSLSRESLKGLPVVKKLEVGTNGSLYEHRVGDCHQGAASGDGNSVSIQVSGDVSTHPSLSPIPLGLS